MECRGGASVVAVRSCMNNHGLPIEVGRSSWLGLPANGHELNIPQLAGRLMGCSLTTKILIHKLILTLMPRLRSA